MKLLAYVVARISDHPVLFIFFRSIVEFNFVSIRRRISAELLLGDERRTLDLGCGPGTFSRMFAGGYYVGLDINSRYIDWAKRHRPGTFIAGDARHVPLPDGHFNEVLIFGLLHHLPDADVRAVLSDAMRLLVRGGRILVIEDIPAVSRLNLIGRLIHSIENGKYIRPVEQYQHLYREFGSLTNEEVLRSGICDYYKVVVVKS